MDEGKEKLVNHPKDFHTDMNMEQLSDFVAEELNKLKVSLFAFELLRVPTIKNAVLGSFRPNLAPQ